MRLNFKPTTNKLNILLISACTVIYGCKKNSDSDNNTPSVKSKFAIADLTGRWTINQYAEDLYGNGQKTISDVSQYPCVANFKLDLNADGSFAKNDLGGICYINPGQTSATTIGFDQPFTGSWAIKDSTLYLNHTNTNGAVSHYYISVSRINQKIQLVETDTLIYFVGAKTYTYSYYSR